MNAPTTGTAKKTASFNRYMVECESSWQPFYLLTDHGFNRYMVECELKSTVFLYFSVIVLIDTWWNVNVSADTTKQVTYPVLIDIWWNDNKENIIKIKGGK